MDGINFLNGTSFGAIFHQKTTSIRFQTMSRKLERFTLLLVPFWTNIHPKSLALQELASKKIRKAPVFQRSKWIKIDVCPGDDLQRLYPSDQTHPVELNLAWRRTFHERDSLSLVRLMKSSTFGLGLTWTTVRCKWNKSYKTCGNEIKSRKILAVVNAISDAIA